MPRNILAQGEFQGQAAVTPRPPTGQPGRRLHGRRIRPDQRLEVAQRHLVIDCKGCRIQVLQCISRTNKSEGAALLGHRDRHRRCSRSRRSHRRRSILGIRAAHAAQGHSGRCAREQATTIEAQRQRVESMVGRAPVRAQNRVLSWQQERRMSTAATDKYGKLTDVPNLPIRRAAGSSPGRFVATDPH